MSETIRFQLIVTIVAQGQSEPLIDAAKGAGAEGVTIVRGRGSGINESGKFFGVPIEPEKEILLILININKTNPVMDALVSAGNLDQPGHGIAFVLDVPRVEGIVHLGEVFNSQREN
jgi:nitrogen regulatory protein P-II 1